MVNPTRKPHSDEYADLYASYVAAVEEPLLERLESEAAEWRDLLAAVPPDHEGYRYAPGKWSIREVVGHVIDAERKYIIMYADVVPYRSIVSRKAMYNSRIAPF